MYYSPKPKYIESEHFKNNVKNKPFTIIDGGARGELFAPFDKIDYQLDVFTFEPDINAQTCSTTSNINATNLSYALWNSSGTIKLHLAKNRSTSSVYAPNENYLKYFPDHIGVQARMTELLIEIPSISIDDAIDQNLINQPDFIKLDIHSAEYEALTGAAKALDLTVGVMVETWHNPVHRGQHLHGEIEHFLNSKGFYLFNIRKAANWKVAVDNATDQNDKSVLIASEALFFKDYQNKSNVSFQEAMFAIACSDTFGYTNHAINLSRLFAEKDIFNKEYQSNIENILVNLKRNRAFNALFNWKTYINKFGRILKGI